MPTENRSSNTEMVSVKRELVEQAMQACFEAGFGIPHDALRDVLAQPAEQHQGEPVAWINFPDEYNKTPLVTWRSPDEQRFYNASVGAVKFSTTRMCLTPLYTRPAQGEPVALPDRREYPDPHDKERYGPFDPKYDEDCAEAEGWNACLDEIAKLGPLYTHADPAEVLNDLEDTKEACTEIERTGTPGDVIREMNDELVYLNTKLAERDALLRHREEMLLKVASGWPLKIYTAEDPLRIETCGRVISYSVGGGMMTTFDPEQMVLSASAEPRDSADLGSCHRRPAWATDGRINTADAPVERDERAEFESKFSTFQLQRHPQHPDCYENPGVHYVWQGWQARAALDRKPS